MGAKVFKDSRGMFWLVDLDGVRHLIRSYVRSTAVLSRSRIHHESQAMGPLGTFEVKLVTVQVDFPAVNAQVKEDSEKHYQFFRNQLQDSGQRAFETLLGWRSETIDANESFRENQVYASQQTNDSINSAISNSQTAIAVTKFIRDTSASVVMVGAAFLTGGAAIAAVGGGSVLKGGFTYQDKKMEGASTSDAAGAATLEAVSDIVLGFISFGEAGAMTNLATKAAKVQAGTIVLAGATVDAETEFVKSTVDGKTIREAALAGAMRFGTHVAGAGLGPLVEHAFEIPKMKNFSFPILVTRSGAVEKSLSALTVETGMSIGSDALVKVAGVEHSKESKHHNDGWHTAVACTYPLMGDSDLVFVEKHAMQRFRGKRSFD